MEGGTIGTPDKTDLGERLARIRSADGVIATTLISREGMTLVSDLPTHVDPDILALRTAFMQGIGELLMESVEAEEAHSVVVIAKEHYILTSPVDDRYILVVLMDRSVDLGTTVPAVLERAHELGEGLKGHSSVSG